MKTKQLLLYVSINLFMILSMSHVQAKDFIVEIHKKKFIPNNLVIAVGDKVIWKNIEKRQYHNVWFKGLDKEEPDYFFPDESYQRTFNEMGNFSYECGPHPMMKGTVTVEN